MDKYSRHYSEGIVGDDAVILCDGMPMTAGQVVDFLNRYEAVYIENGATLGGETTEIDPLGEDSGEDTEKAMVLCAKKLLTSDVIDLLEVDDLLDVSEHFMHVSRYAKHRAWMLRAEQVLEDDTAR